MRKLYQVITLTTTVLFLSGCIGVLAISGASVLATKAIMDPRSLGKQIDNNILDLKLTHILAKNELPRKEVRVIVTVYQQKVLLTGQLPNSKVIQQIEKQIQQEEGVTDVYNEIRIGKPISLKTVAYDTWITSKLRSMLLTKKEIASFDIKVITENGEVFLLGVVTPTAGKIAAETASKLSGVKRVITLFTNKA